MKNNKTWLAIAIAAAIVAIACAVYIYTLGLEADAQGTAGSMPTGILILGSAALLISIVSFVRAARLLAERRR